MKLANQKKKNTSFITVKGERHKVESLATCAVYTKMFFFVFFFALEKLVLVCTFLLLWREKFTQSSDGRSLCEMTNHFGLC